MACRCWECRRAAGIRAVAPRLATAWDQAQRLVSLRREQRGEVLHLEHLVAHRDLQLVRAFHVGDPRYIKRRQHKLDQATRWLGAARRHLEELV